MTRASTRQQADCVRGFWRSPKRSSARRGWRRTPARVIVQPTDRPGSALDAAAGGGEIGRRVKHDRDGFAPMPAFSSAGEPEAATRPWSSTTMSSAMRSASSKLGTGPGWAASRLVARSTRLRSPPEQVLARLSAASLRPRRSSSALARKPKPRGRWPPPAGYAEFVRRVAVPADRRTTPRRWSPARASAPVDIPAAAGEGAAPASRRRA
jgi:hypothetical protein